MPELSSVTVPAIKSFEHEGRQYQVGEPVSVPPVVALVLHRKGYISLEPNPTYRTRALTSEPETIPLPCSNCGEIHGPGMCEKSRRRGRPRKQDYQRRDLRAEE